MTYNSGQPIELYLGCPAPFNETYPLCYNPYAVFPIAWSGDFTGDVSFVSSGRMSFAAGLPRTKSLTFTKEGIWSFVDLWNGETLTIQVETDRFTWFPTAAQVDAEAQQELTTQSASIPLLREAAAQALASKPPFTNAQGTFSYPVLAGFEFEKISAPIFFPKNISIHSGDEIIFLLHENSTSPGNAAFYNGLTALALTTDLPLPPDAPAPFSDAGLPAILVALNPLIVNPQNPVGSSLALQTPEFRIPTSDNVTLFSTGLLFASGGPLRLNYSMQFAFDFTGTLEYVSDFQGDMGMRASVIVLPVSGTPPSVYHINYYTTQFGGPGLCSPEQWLDVYEIPGDNPLGKCTKLLEAPPFSSFIKMVPAMGPNETSCNHSNCVHFLRWDQLTSLAPCILGITPDPSFVAPLDGSCVVVDRTLQVRITAAVALVISFPLLLLVLSAF